MTTSDGVVALLVQYLDAAELNGRRWVIDGEPLQQSFTVKGAQWEPLAQTLSGDVQAGVLAALERIGVAGDRVDRKMLAAASKRIGRSDTDRVMCWFLVMAWGAGPRDRSRLRQWTRALPSARFLVALEASVDALAKDQLADAYTVSKLPGVGESYLTKWLWAAGLASAEMPVRPAVLDNRVWEVLGLLRWSPQGRNKAERWVDYCAALAIWAQLVCEHRPDWTVDSDRLEQLFFDRDRRTATPFIDWLGNLLV